MMILLNNNINPIVLFLLLCVLTTLTESFRPLSRNAGRTHRFPPVVAFQDTRPVEDDNNVRVTPLSAAPWFPRRNVSNDDSAVIWEKLDRMETKMESMETKLDSMETTLTEMKTSITTIKTDVETIKTDVETIKIELKYMAVIGGFFVRLHLPALQKAFEK